MGKIELDDPRENAEWFRRLPDHAKAEFRARWRDQGDADARRAARRKQTYIRYAIEGVVLFAGLEFVFGSVNLGRVAFLTLPGAGLGLACAWLKPSRYVYMLCAAAAYVVVYGPMRLFALWHFVIFCCVAMGIGLMHEVQRGDGTEAL